MSNELQEGAVFANRYRIVRCMARGGMGAVYEVIHLETERRRALKVMHGHILHSADLRSRFQREARVAAQVESEFIVDVFDAGVDEATQMPFLVMEFLRGEEVGKRLRRLGRLPAAEVAHYLHQTALALDKTHQANVVHRDLKPENLFLAEREEGLRIKVLDFGIAKVVAEGTTSGSATLSIGTPLYMSPEQFNPRAGLTGASDIYALGMIAYTLLVGVAYWDQESKEGSIFHFGAIAINGPQEAASVRALKRGVRLPPGFDAWFAKVTAKDPEQRFARATLAARELGAVLGFQPRAASLSLIEPVPQAQAPAPPRIAPRLQPPPVKPTIRAQPLPRTEGSPPVGHDVASVPASPLGGLRAPIPAEAVPDRGLAPPADALPLDGDSSGDKTLVYAPSSERLDGPGSRSTPAPQVSSQAERAFTPPVFTPSEPAFTPSGPAFTPPGPTLTPSGAALSAAPPPDASLTGAASSATASASLVPQEAPDPDEVALFKAQRARGGIIVGLSAALVLTIGAVAIFAGGSRSGTDATPTTAAAATTTTTDTTTTETAPIAPTATTTPTTTATTTASAAAIAAASEHPHVPRIPAPATSMGHADKPKGTGRKHYTQE